MIRSIKRLPSVNDIVVSEGWGIGRILGIDFDERYPYTVSAFHSGFHVTLKNDQFRLATDAEILAARLQDLCPSLTS